jgi:methionine-gamma-lyase
MEVVSVKQGPKVASESMAPSRAAKFRPESLMMSHGYDPTLSEGALKCPIFQTSTFAFESAEAGKAFFEVAYGLRKPEPGEKQGLIYSRINNPDLEILEERLKLWDQAEACAVFSSGMAAIGTSLLSYVRPGDAVVHSEPLYGGTEFLLEEILPRFNVKGIPFPAGLPAKEVRASIEAKLEGRPVAAAIIETPANPTNALVDIQEVAQMVRSWGAPGRRPVVMVDNTFLGPLWQHPLEHGADLVLYSATKFIGGHSDVIAGACLGTVEAVKPIREMRTFLGTVAGPWTGWLLLRSLETLKMRMTASVKNARYVADFLAKHPKVERVHYLGHLPETAPMYRAYRKQCLSPGSVVSFEIRGGQPAAFRFLNALELIHLAVSLGGTESLAEHPGSMTHADVPPPDQARMGITPAMVRVSVGVEHYEDILADVAQALEKS